MSESGNKWRDKYLDALDQQEATEREYQKQVETLQRALVRVSVAADGQQSSLDRALEALRAGIRKSQPRQFEAALKDLDSALLTFDDRREEMAQELKGSLQSLIVPLLAREPARPIKRELRDLAQQVSRQQELMQLYPQMLKRLASLQAEVLANDDQTTSGAAEKSGFLQRFLGRPDHRQIESRETEAPQPTSELEHDRGKADRALFELNPNATLRDSETVSENMRSIINDLLQSVEAQDVAPERVGALQSRLQSGIANADLIPVLEEVRDLVMAAYMAATRAFAAYLNQVNMELGDIYGALDSAANVSDRLRSASDSMQEDMLAEFVKLQSQTSEATELKQLQSQVQDRLGNIRAVLNSYRAKAEDSGSATEQLSALADRLRTMESEAKLNRQVLEEQRAKALTDTLTGIANREAYNERIALEEQRFRRYGNPLTLAVCDLDYFKKINDTLGHQAGDRVLRVLSNAIGKRLRDVDFFGRYGGEEFVVVMPETSAVQAQQFLDRIRAAIASTEFSYREQPVELTVSIGIAEFQGRQSAEEVFARADAALYEAKAAGRNQCRIG